MRSKISIAVIIAGFLLIIGGIAFTVLGIYSSFEGMKNAEIAGISVVADGIARSIWSTLFSIVGFFVVIIGVIGFILDKLKPKI
jgi:uncharacterized membrane protein